MKKQPKAAAAIRAEKATGKQPTAASQLPNLEDLCDFSPLPSKTRRRKPAPTTTRSISC